MEQFYKDLAEKIYEGEVRWTSLINYKGTNNNDKGIIDKLADKESINKNDNLIKIDGRVETIYKISEHIKQKTEKKKYNYEGYVELSKFLYQPGNEEKQEAKKIIDAKKNLLDILLDEEEQLADNTTIGGAIQTVGNYNIWIEKILEKARKEFQKTPLDKDALEVWATIYGMGKTEMPSIGYASNFTLMKLRDEKKENNLNVKLKKVGRALQDQIDSEEFMKYYLLHEQLADDLDWSEIDENLKKLGGY